MFKKIIKKFSNYQFQDLNKKSNDKTYVFIVGLPRSGTSLVEQILSSHSYVYGAGELQFFPDAIKNEFLMKDKPIDDKITQTKVADIFNKNVSTFNSKEKYLTDKNPLNFLWIGFIKLVFPNSKVIHIKRDIKDNYFSLFKNTFDGNMNWCYNKSDLLKYCQKYKEITDFWNDKIPDFVLNIQYEDLISNTKKEVNKILEFCNLPWEDNCLEF